MTLRLLFLFFFGSVALQLSAQVTCDPVFPNVDSDVTIYFHADEGNAALAGYTQAVYAHMGVITTSSQHPGDWKYVQTTWGVADPDGLMTNAGPNLWTKSFNIRTFFGIPAGETVLKLAFVFRNLNGQIVGRAADGSDIFYDVYPAGGDLLTRFVQPLGASFLTDEGVDIDVKAAASESADLRLYDNDIEISATTGLSLESTVTTSAGYHVIRFVATTATQSDTSVFSYLVADDPITEDAPSGTVWGIDEIDGQTVRLALYAPGKINVFVIGDFNDWAFNPDYQMRRSVDGSLWWLEIGGLTSGQTYRFQYVVDGVIKIADPLSTLVLDPSNDGFIAEETFPDLPAYPGGQTTGAVSVFELGQTPFNWQTPNFTPPAKTNLVIYELLMRDFLARHDYPTLLDTLDYLQNLGVTAIELMPVNEFDGNINWGYGPAFHKALDKYYGSPEAFKTVVDECHARGMAVILDVVFNQVTGDSPLAKLYWDAANNRPAANNPWLNPVATHPFNVFNDVNHESQATKIWVKNCLEYWLSEYHVDGFRFDLSKGFTQTNSGSNVGLWGQYDATRVATLKDYADYVWSIDADAYVILEHFADNTEEKELAEYGMMLWGNMWEPYKNVALGYSNSTSLTWAAYSNRGWSVPHLITYFESHDEDRIGYECKTYGNQASGYNVRSLSISMRRIEMLGQLLYAIPGPKMLWQFGELGYDFPINWCQDGTINPDCRTSPKPIRWDYFQNAYRRRLYNVYAALLNLRQNYPAFQEGSFELNIGGGQQRTIFLNHPDGSAALFVNVGVTSSTFSNPNFSHDGVWYEYYTGDSVTVSGGTPGAMTLAAGEYRLYLDHYTPLPGGVVITSTNEVNDHLGEVQIVPNPAGDEGAAVIFTLLESDEIQGEVRDASGKVMTRLGAQSLPAGQNGWRIDTAEWPHGVYFVTLRQANGWLTTRKLVK